MYKKCFLPFAELALIKFLHYNKKKKKKMMINKNKERCQFGVSLKQELMQPIKTNKDENGRSFLI